MIISVLSYIAGSIAYAMGERFASHRPLFGCWLNAGWAGLAAGVGALYAAMADWPVAALLAVTAVMAATMVRFHWRRRHHTAAR